jgi:hypothetical protein
MVTFLFYFIWGLVFDEVFKPHEMTIVSSDSWYNSLGDRMNAYSKTIAMKMRA